MRLPRVCEKVSVPAIVENGYHFKQFATVCRQPICKRRAIQSKVMTVSLLKRAAILTLSKISPEWRLIRECDL
jgi:hypothetical protein